MPSNDGNSAAESSIKVEATGQIPDEKSISCEIKNSIKSDSYTDPARNKESAEAAEQDSAKYTSIEQTINSNVNNDASAQLV